MIRSHEEVAALIPWYANGTLADEERTAVESHLAVGCDHCHALLDDARLLMTAGLDAEQLAGGFASAGALRDHPQAQILREFAERSAALGEEIVASVRSHLADCEPCRTAVEAAAAGLEADDPSPAAAAIAETEIAAPPSTLHLPPQRPGHPPGSGLWGWLTGSLLRPELAAVYLVLLLAALPMLRGLRPTPGSPAVLPPPVTVTGERVMRRAPEEQPPTPQSITVEPASERPIYLALRTNIDREDLDDPDASFDVLLLHGDQVVWSKVAVGASFSADRELRLLVPAALLRQAPTTVVIRFIKPGDPLHGSDLFRRTLSAR